MIVEALIVAAVAFALELITGAIGRLIDLWGQEEMPETVQAELSDTDKEKIAATKDLIEECFGVNVTDKIRNSSNKERIALMAQFAERLAREYDLDIEVDVTVNNVNNCGFYDWKEKKAVFNIALLMVDGNHEHFEYCVIETIDTIVHELRHAVQHHAIENGSFWNVDETRRKAWADNMAPGNYIRADVDLKGYTGQPIESDAFTFAAMVMKGVK